jgi:transposase, IS5 family
MREIVPKQPSLLPVLIQHPHAAELRKISDVLDALPQAAALVHVDLVDPKTKRLGKHGMPAEQVLRALIIKQMNNFSYEELRRREEDRAGSQGSNRLHRRRVEHPPSE